LSVDQIITPLPPAEKNVERQLLLPATRSAQK
jgi:hypothetical protein